MTVLFCRLQIDEAADISLNRLFAMTPNSSFSPDPHANWIWLSQKTRTRNIFGLFRGKFRAEDLLGKFELWITADSRYEVYLNGERLGSGPPRSWREPWPIDSYDLEGRLIAGENVIAVRALSLGRDTFQYLHAPAGVFVEVRNGKDTLAVTNSHWIGIVDPEVVWPTPRMCSQMGWEEVLDGRQEARDKKNRHWTHPDYDDTLWLPVVTTSATAPNAPHHRLTSHDLPPLTEDWREPIKCLERENVRPAPYVWTIDLREALAPDDLSANVILGDALLTTFLYSPTDQEVVFGDPHARRLGGWQLNNEELIFDDAKFIVTGPEVARTTLNAGWNRLLVKVDSPCMLPRIALCLWAEPGVRACVVPRNGENESWRLLGPIKDQTESVVWEGGTQAAPARPAGAFGNKEDLEDWWKNENWLHDDKTPGAILHSDWVCTEDIYARGWSDRAIISGPVCPDEFPSQRGLEIPLSSEGDPRLLFDFGEELVGETEFEIEAPAGTIIDGIGIEFIQNDGRFNLPEGVNNSFRYICRDGRQIFRSTQRRGYRYLWLIFRAMEKPVLLKSLRTRFSTFPQARRGAFACSNKRLEEIWQVGAHGLRCCSEDTYTDCPTYEQTHWIGDARNEAMIDLVVNGDPRLSRHCWFQAAQSLERSVLVESLVPSGWQVLIPSFTWLWLDWAAWHYTYTGDEATARTMFPWIKRLLDNVNDLLSDRNLFEMPAWNLIDWAPMDINPTGAVTHVNALLAWGADRAGWLAEELNFFEEAKAWRELAAKVREATNRWLWGEERQSYADCLDISGNLSLRDSFQTQVVAILSGLAQDQRLEHCRQRLQLPWTDGRVGTPFFAGFVLQGLVQENRWPEALERILSYWGGQIEEGATAFWEMFQPWEPRLTRSHCHGWAGIPCFFLSRESLGIQPLRPGFTAVQIAPQTHGLRWAKGAVPTPDGAIQVSWKHENSHFDLKFSGLKQRLYRIELPEKMEFLSGSEAIHWLEMNRVFEARATAGEFKFEMHPR